MSFATLKIIVVGKKHPKRWGCNFSCRFRCTSIPSWRGHWVLSEQRTASRWPKRRISMRYFKYLIIMVWLFDLFQGTLCVYFQLHRTSVWEPAPLAPGCRGHLCWFASCWSSPFHNRWVLLGVDLFPCTWKFMLLDLKQPLLPCKKELIE